MTTILQATDTLYQKYLDDATLITVATDLTFDNENYDPPDDTPWCRLTVRHFGATQESLGDVGARKFLRRGAVFIQVMTPQDSGRRTGDLIAQEAREIFEGKTLSGVRLYAADIREGGLSDGNLVTLVETAFDYTETR